MSISISERVALGASILDKKVPNWYEKINLETLDMNRTRHCILGQVFPDLNYPVLQGLIQLQIKGFGIQEGFDIRDSEVKIDGVWDLLKQTWISEIKMRLSNTANVD